VLTYLQAIVLGLLQGVTELFPVSSLGHSVIVPQVLGWTDVVAAQSASESYFLAFLVGLHVATALALVVFYRDTWARIVVAVVGSLRTRRIATADARLGWLLIVATIPAGLVGVLFEHVLRVLFAVPLAAAGFLIVNGLILLGGEVVRRRAAVRTVARIHGTTSTGDRRLDTLEFREAGLIGVAQVLALFAGISRSGITMVAGSCGASITRTPPASHSCWRRRSSWPRGFTNCPICSARTALGCRGRSSPGVSRRRWPRTPRCAS
jgi:undecaprenyl-diphosphatase